MSLSAPALVSEYPTVFAYERNGQAIVACPFEECDQGYHLHSVGSGLRSAHCLTIDGPRRNYELEMVAGEVPDHVEALVADRAKVVDNDGVAYSAAEVEQYSAWSVPVELWPQAGAVDWTDFTPTKVEPRGMTMTDNAAVDTEDDSPFLYLFVDVAAMLAGGLPDAPEPTFMRRDDGVSLFYAGKVNVLFGDPESGKSWIAYAAVVQALRSGIRAAIVDVDHNGATDILTRLIALGAAADELGDLDLFRLAEPEDGKSLLEVVAALRTWGAELVVVDSIGEILPMLGLSSNSPDDYTLAHRKVLTALTGGGAGVIAIDHLPKSDDAREHGQTGTMAKRRAVNGVSLRVTLVETFAPGKGGAASLTIHKDRPGGLRGRCPVVGKHQPAGRFVMSPELDGSISWHVTQPLTSDSPSGPSKPADIAEVDGLDPLPSGVRDVMDRCSWGYTRAKGALEGWREHRASDVLGHVLDDGPPSVLGGVLGDE